jgi:hypothetical protein
MIRTPAAPAMPAEISKAIGEVMTQIKSLPKGERNDHGNYNFTSIDDFLAFVGPLCSAAGLLVYQDEDSIDLIDRGGKAWMKVCYSFTLGHVSGVVSSRPMRRTVLQAVTGPQTTGSSQSYALKQFMRSLFLIPTGDRDDADYQRQQDMPAAQVQQPRRTETAPKPQKPSHPAPSASDKPVHIPIPADTGGLRIRDWLDLAKAALDGRPEAWRRRWLELHEAELEDLRAIRPDWADRVEAAAIAPDAPAGRTAA